MPAMQLQSLKVGFTTEATSAILYFFVVLFAIPMWLKLALNRASHHILDCEKVL